MKGLARTAALRAWLDFAALHEALGGEVHALSTPQHEGEAQRRRSYVRAAFAYVEGIVFALKQATLATAPERYTELERPALAEAPRGRVSGGKVKEETYKITLADNVQFALVMFSRLTDQPPTIAYGDGWEAFKLSIKVRDRLMHPRRLADIEVSDAELQQLDAGIGWFANTFIGLAGEARRAMDAMGTLPPQVDDERRSAEYASVLTDLRAAERRINGPRPPPSPARVLRRVLDLLGIAPRRR